VLCPTLLPRPSSSLQTGVLPPVVGSASGPGAYDIEYGGPSNQPALNAPDNFLHFDFANSLYAGPPPPGGHRAIIGRKRGLLVPATRAQSAYFGNHVKFFWHEERGWDLATLHDFGPRTSAVPSAIVGHLVPAAQLPDAKPGAAR